MTPATSTAPRMGLRKREPPTTSLVRQRNEFISQVTKRQRSLLLSQKVDTTTIKDMEAPRSEDVDMDTADNSTSSGSDTDDDYEERRTQKRPTVRVRSLTQRATTSVGAASVQYARLRCGRASRTNKKALTFLQNARQHNIPVRSGKWNQAEDMYLRKLAQLFIAGVLDDVEPRMSMRSWLSKMISCCPLRISKKQMHGEKFRGKARYTRNTDRIERMTQKDYDRWWREVTELRINFLRSWAREEFGRWSHEDHPIDFHEWYANVQRVVRKPRIAKPPSLTTIDEEEEEDDEEDEPLDCWTMPLPENNQASSSRQAEVQPAPQIIDIEQPCPDCSLIGCQKSTCPAHILDMVLDADSDVLEPMPSPQVDFEVDIDTLGWELFMKSPCKPPAMPLMPLRTTATHRTPKLVLDFGPPSMWNPDQSSSNHVSSSCSEWVEDFINDESLLALDPLLPAPEDAASPCTWFQQLNSSSFM